LALLVGAAFSAQDDAAAAMPAIVGINDLALPAQARSLLPFLEEALAARCPALPALWVVAETEAESGWNPMADSSAGAASLLQMMPVTWVEAGGAGGSWSTSSRPTPDHPVWDPHQHLPVAISWMCANLRLVTAHLAMTGKPTEVLDALAVCHIAGCSRVIDSATGVPHPGEAGCDVGCVQAIEAYLAAIHRYVAVYAAPAPALTVVGLPPQPFFGPSSGCTVPDPSGTGGCVTGVLAHLMAQVELTFGRIPVSCWSARAGDPYSDHPKGMACDYTMGRIGTYAAPADVARGWQLALWLRANATPLHVNYVIWQGRIWSRAHDAEGWRPYTGGGVYDTAGPINGHYDHVHVSTVD
jgi:hypothetical protein